MRKGVSFAMQVLIVVVVIMIVALVVLSIFGGGIASVGDWLSSLTGQAQTECADPSIGGRCKTGSCPADENLNLAGKCPPGQVCCVPIATGE